MENSIVVIAEHAADRVRPVTYELITFAKKLQQANLLAIKVFILGADIGNLAREIADKSSLDVMAFEIPEMTVYNGEMYKNVLKEHLPGAHPAYVCVAHTSQGLDFAPALAMELDAACISGVEDVLIDEQGVCFARPLYGGKIIAHVRPVSETSIATIQVGFFKSDMETGQVSGTVAIQAISTKPQKSRSIGLKQIDSDTADITEAKVIVAAGQGIGDKDNLDLVHQLTSLFTKSAVAGSRIVCDLGWLEYRRQVGVTGATVSPQLYIACGISGAIQHVTGMRGSEFIVAINKDPAASIFQVADICIVEDLTTFIPIFIESYLKPRKSVSKLDGTL